MFANLEGEAVPQEEIRKVEKQLQDMDKELLKRKKIFKNMIDTVMEMSNQKREQVLDMIGLEE